MSVLRTPPGTADPHPPLHPNRARVGAAGEAFDPNLHEAVSTAPAPTPEQDHVVQSVLQPGYKFGGALLRPARVIVFLWHEPELAPDSPPGA